MAYSKHNTKLDTEVLKLITRYPEITVGGLLVHLTQSKPTVYRSVRRLLADGKILEIEGPPSKYLVKGYVGPEKPLTLKEEHPFYPQPVSEWNDTLIYYLAGVGDNAPRLVQLFRDLDPLINKAIDFQNGHGRIGPEDQEQLVSHLQEIDKFSQWLSFQMANLLNNPKLNSPEWWSLFDVRN